MLSKKLAALAVEDHLRHLKVQRWRLGLTTGGILKYLYWRNRFPLLLKILTRSLVIVEVFLINHYFNFFLASSFGLIFFIFYYLRELHRGVVQSVKKCLLEKYISKQSSGAYDLIKRLLLVNITYGIICPLLFLLFIYFNGENQQTLLFVSLWIVIFPLQLLANSFWTLLYGFHRLKRSFWLILLCRLVPVFALILLGEVSGIMAYFIGFIAGRSFENVYLISISWAALNRGLLKQNDSKSKEKIYNNYAQLLFPLCFPLYNIFLALLIYIRDSGEWLTHFFVIYILNILLFIALRGPQSLMMDFYLCILNLNAGNALKWLKLSCKVRNVVILLLSIMLAVPLVLGSQYYLSIPLLTAFLPMVIIMLLARALLQTQLLYIQAGFLEKQVLCKLAAACFVLILFQTYALLFLRVDLNFIYMSEGVLLMLLALFIRSSTKSAAELKQSEIYKYKESYLKSRAAWLETDKLFAAVQQGRYHYLCIQIDTEYERLEKRDHTLASISGSLSVDLILIPVYPGIYFLACPPDILEQKLIRKLKLAHPAIIRSVIKFDMLNFEDSLKQLLQALRKSNQQHAALNRFQYFVELVLQSKLLVNDFADIQDLNSALDLSFKKYKLDQLRVIYKEGCSIPQNCRPEHIDFALNCFHGSEFRKFLLYYSKNSFLQIVTEGQPVAVIDSSGMGSEQVNVLHQLVLGINLRLLQQRLIPKQ